MRYINLRLLTYLLSKQVDTWNIVYELVHRQNVTLKPVIYVVVRLPVTRTSSSRRRQDVVGRRRHDIVVRRPHDVVVRRRHDDVVTTSTSRRRHDIVVRRRSTYWRQCKQVSKYVRETAYMNSFTV